MRQISLFSNHHHVDSFVEALGFTAMELNSAFAGDQTITPYEALLETARQSELNDNRFIRPAIARARTMWKKYQNNNTAKL